MEHKESFITSILSKKSASC